MIRRPPRSTLFPYPPLSRSQRQIGREPQDPREPLGVAQPGVERDRPALGKPREGEPRRRDPAPLLAGDERLDPRLRGAHACLVLASHAFHAVDVVPGAHHHAPVERHRLHGRVREDEADPRLLGQVECRDDGLEVVAVGAEAVQPDDARLRVLPRLDLERVEEVGHRSTSGGPPPAPPPPPPPPPPPAPPPPPPPPPPRRPPPAPPP